MMNIRNFPMVPRVIFGRGCFNQLDEILSARRDTDSASMIFLLDDIFRDKSLKERIPLRAEDHLLWVNVDDEPKTSYVDELTAQIRGLSGGEPAGVIGIGGGSTMDLAKAVALMLTNPGSASDYQGWDLIQRPGVYHVGIPTLSGTGAEVSRTTVLTGPVRKLGLNSDHTPFDQIVLDPDLIAGAPNPQRFYTGMDCFIHCVESLEGTYLNAFSRAYGEKSLQLCREVFLQGHTADSDEKLMMASYFGGMSIAYSQVGVCHALSYGLSYVLGLHHGIGNCVAFEQLEEYYPEGVREFREMMRIAGIDLPRGVVHGISEAEMDKMISVALSLEPLWENALGATWKEQMTPERVRRLYEKM